MKVATYHLQYLFVTSSYPFYTSQLFVSSFLQGAHSNTAIRNHYYNANTLLKAKSLVSPFGITSNSIHINTSNASSRSSSRLYGFLNPFEFNSSGNEDDDNDDEEEEEVLFSSAELENARQSFEDMFTMPNDNIDTNLSSTVNNNKSTTTTSSSSSSMYIKSDEDDVANPNDASNNDPDSTSTNKNKQRRRRQRETLTSSSSRDISKIAKTIPPPPLTAIARERRLREITLLSTLTESDDAVNELWALWISERGPAAATLLLRAEQLMSVESYDEAERLLWSLIHQHGVHWAEPVNRLATLKYMQGRLDESKALCEVVLQVKPWHFGALSGIVLVCTALNDATGARLWAERRLPPLIPEHTSGDRRVQWISRALNDAAENLDKASKVGRDKEIGREETEFRTFRAKMQKMAVEEENKERGKREVDRDGAEDLDAWQ